MCFRNGSHRSTADIQVYITSGKMRSVLGATLLLLLPVEHNFAVKLSRSHPL